MVKCIVDKERACSESQVVRQGFEGVVALMLIIASLVGDVALRGLLVQGLKLLVFGQAHHELFVFGAACQ